MSIELRVKSILDKRQEKVIGYEDILNKLDRCSSLISKAKIAAKPILSGIAITDPHKIGEIKSVVTTLTSLDNSSEISSLRKKILMAKQRCGRSYINIGILAPWRHGKSQFLCKVFRLKAEEEKYLIPTDGDKQRACTGTTVNYQNGEENKCEFEVFSEDEIIEAILDLCKLCEIPTENIKSRSLSELVDFINKNYSSKIENVNEKTAPQALKEYVVGYPHYGPIVAKGSIDPITFELDKDVIDSRLSEIYKYICFYSSPTETNKHNNFRCLGIKKVSISMPLKSVDGESLGKIRFLDTPGLGESRPNVESNVKAILKEDIDIVICVCQTNKYVDSDEFDKFNSFLCTDFNIEYIGQDKKSHDASKSIHYILNVNQEVPSVQRDIYEAKELCITGSMKAVTKGNRISIEDAHIHVLDVKQDVLVNLIKESKNEEGKYIWEYKALTEVNACVRMLEDCLSSLEKDIEEVDNFFNREADMALAEIKNYFLTIRSSVFSAKLPPISSGALQHSLLNELVLKFKEVNLLREKSDKSMERLSTFVGRGSANITCEFLSKISGMNNIDTINEISKVVPIFRDSQKILSDTSFSQLYEMAQYADLKRSFKNFYIDCLSKCLDADGIKLILAKVASLICKELVDAFKPVLGNDTTSDNIISRLKALNEEQPSCGVIAKYIENVSNVGIINETIEQYVDIDLSKFFHMEKSNYATDQYIGLSRTALATTFIYWIDNICSSLNKAVIAQDTPGVSSFSSLVEGIYKNYENNVLENFFSANNPENELGHAMCDFYSDNIDSLGDISKRKSYIIEWNRICQSILETL